MNRSSEKAKRKKWLPRQFSLTLALAMFTIACIAMAWFNWTQRFARAAQAMEKMQVVVSYDAAWNNREKPQPDSIPKWKADIFGEDFCFEMNRLDIRQDSVESSPNFWQDLAKHQSAMPAVEVVKLQKIKVTTEAIEVLANLPLVEIFFFECQLEDGVLESLSNFPKLRTVLFSEVQQDLNYRLLAKSQQLTQIGLEDCKIDLETAEHLRAKLPEAFVFVF